MQNIKLHFLEAVLNKKIFGFHNVEDEWFIGITAVQFKDNKTVMIKGEKFSLTNGLVNLLSQSIPKNYTKQDLKNYKNILLLTSAHKQNFRPHGRIASSTKWKYLNIIKNLFPPNRIYPKSKCSKK